MGDVYRPEVFVSHRNARMASTMSEPTACARAQLPPTARRSTCWSASTVVDVIEVTTTATGLRVVVESSPALTGRPRCGVVVGSPGRRDVRLLDLVPGRSGAAYAEWLKARSTAFRDGIEVATLDPFHDYENAIDDQLEDAVAVLDAFHIVKLGTTALDEVRRRVQQQTLGHRGRSGDPLYGIRNMLRAGAERLTDKQWSRLDKAIAANEAHRGVRGVVLRPTAPGGLPPLPRRRRQVDR
jgi:hypothetical protein